MSEFMLTNIHDLKKYLRLYVVAGSNASYKKTTSETMHLSIVPTTHK